METIFSIVIAALMGYWCYRIAQKNGRSPVLAMFMGLLFGIFSVLIYYLIGPTKTKKLEIAKKLVEKNK